jgi:hypothetical protein
VAKPSFLWRSWLTVALNVALAALLLRAWV